MTPEIALYVLGAAAIPALAWGISISWLLKVLVVKTDRLLMMHENPDNTGFGTAPIILLVERNTKAIAKLDRTVTELLIWLKATSLLDPTL